MRPKDPQHWQDVIDDLSFDEFKVTQLPPHRVQRGTCEACSGPLMPMSYAVHVELPLAVDGMDHWHFFGDICWDCMAAVVMNHGCPTAWNGTRELGSAVWEDFGDQW